MLYILVADGARRIHKNDPRALRSSEKKPRLHEEGINKTMILNTENVEKIEIIKIFPAVSVQNYT